MWQWLVGRRCHRQWGGGALGFTSEVEAVECIDAYALFVFGWLSSRRSRVGIMCVPIMLSSYLRLSPRRQVPVFLLKQKSDPHQIPRPNDRSMERTHSLFVDDLASRQQRW